MKKIGYVGGISWVSTVEYYRLVNQKINEKLGGLNFAECILYSVNFGDIQATGWDNAYGLLHKACLGLKAAGAEAIVLCANTAHIVAEKLARETGLTIISIVSATAAAVKEKGLQRVGLLGTQYTMEKDFYRAGLAKAGVEAIIPASQQDRDFIQYTLKEELGRGILKETTKAAYLKIMEGLAANGAEGIILGCTEIPLLIASDDVDIPVFDTLQIHVGAAVAFALADQE